MESHDTELERELRQALITTAEPVRGEGVRQDVVLQTVARRRRTRRTARATLVGLAAAAAVAVGFLVSTGGEDRVRTVDRPPSASSSTTATSAPEPDEQPDPSAASSTTSQDSTTTTSTSTPSTPPSSTTTPSTTPTTAPRLPDFPPKFTDLTQGGNAWALYLAVVADDQQGSPEYQAALAASAEAGYGGFGGGDLACDRGAPEALGRDGDWSTVAVYFESQAQAEQARAAFQARNHPVVGVVQVTTYCLD